MSVHVAMPVSVSQSEEKKSMASLHNRSAGALDQLFGFRTCIGRYCITSTVSKSFLKARVLSALQLCMYNQMFCITLNNYGTSNTFATTMHWRTKVHTPSPRVM